MTQTYKKVGNKLEVTDTRIREVTEFELLEEKQRLEQDKVHAEREVVGIQDRIDELDDKLEVINK